MVLADHEAAFGAEPLAQAEEVLARQEDHPERVLGDRHGVGRLRRDDGDPALVGGAVDPLDAAGGVEHGAQLARGGERRGIEPRSAPPGDDHLGARERGRRPVVGEVAGDEGGVDVEDGAEAGHVRLGEQLREVDGVHREQPRDAVGHAVSLVGLERDNDF
nr:hypothetical protein GCM10025732_31160 [Glycomyces mayteni]